MTVKEEMYSWVEDLWPITRSLTGNGVRDTLAYLKQLMPNLKIRFLNFMVYIYHEV